MKKTAILSIIFLIRIAVSGQVTTAKLDSLLKFEGSGHPFNGSVLVAQNGKIILEKGYGYKNKKENFLNTANTQYQIGSTAQCHRLLQEKKLV